MELAEKIWDSANFLAYLGMVCWLIFMGVLLFLIVVEWAAKQDKKD